MGLIDRLPERFKNRQTGEAVTAPSAILLAGGGAAAAILAGVSVVGVVGIAVVAWVVRVATLVPRKARTPHIDPAHLSDPWRRFVREALDAQRRYRAAVADASPGPLRDRLTEIGERLDAGVQECWRIARRGDALIAAIGNLDVTSARAELETAKQAAKATPGDAQDGTVKALQAQVDSAERLIAVARDAQDRLRLLDARLDEAVARAVELSVRAEDVGELGGLGGDVDTLVSELETLRGALDEAGGGAPAGDTTPAGGTAQAAGAGGV